MQFLLHKKFQLTGAYIVLGLGMALQAFFPQKGLLAMGSMIAVLLSAFPSRMQHTVAIGSIAIAALFFFNLKQYDYKGLNISGMELFLILGVLLSILIVLANQKEKITTEKSLRELESLFQYSTIGMVITNQKGQILDFNQCAQGYFGYTKEELRGKNVELLLPGRFREKHVGYREKFHEHPAPRTMGAGRDLHARKKNGEEFPVEVSLSHYTSGKETYVIAYVIDITVRKKNEAIVLAQKQALEETTRQISEMNHALESRVEGRTRMLQETLAALEESKMELSEALEKEKELSDLKSRFVTMASHEFRTPLSAILSSAYLLEQYNLQPEQEEKRWKHIQRIRESVSGMKGILEDFLSLGKLEEGVVKPNPELKALPALVDELTHWKEDLQLLTKKGQVLHVETEGSGDVWVDTALLKNIFINLVSNAIKFSGENQEIAIRLKNDPENFSLSVADKGMGISEEDQVHLFERFFRARNAGNIQGTGLGLHIVQRYADLLNGNIAFTSKLGEGSEFCLTIPHQSNVHSNLNG
ncbi:MAG: PAS domain-containing sensor histidine kinase [Chitinophagaceae bacterium]